jgi:citrate synthase
MHRSGDPRGRLLLEWAAELGIAGAACALVDAMEEALAEAVGRRIVVNVDGGQAAVLTDLGIDWRYSRPLGLVGRLPTNSAHAVEEMTRPSSNWRDLVVVGERYEGPAPRPVQKTETE